MKTQNKEVKLQYTMLKEKKDGGRIYNTYEPAIRVVGIINCALKEILVDPGDIVVGLYLARHIMAIYGEGAHMLAYLLYWLKRLQHLCSLVQHVLLHRHRLSWGNWLIPASNRCWIRRFIAGSHRKIRVVRWSGATEAVVWFLYKWKRKEWKRGRLWAVHVAMQGR